MWDKSDKFLDHRNKFYLDKNIITLPMLFTCVLKENMINKLMIFERKIMMKIFSPTRSDDGYWRIQTNQEIIDILKGRNMFGVIKKQRLNWLGHVERMAEDTNVQKIKRWKPMSKRPIGRPKTRWENDVLEDIRYECRQLEENSTE
jgi:hypothetical protein